MFVYKITNKINGLIYVGKTRRTLKARWKEHCGYAKDLSKTQPISVAMREFGKENFTIDVLESECTTLEQLDRMERFWIDELHALDPAIGYNATAGGQNGAVIVDVERRSLATKYNWAKPETRERRLAGMRDAYRNKPLEEIEETNAKISEAAKQQWADPEKRKRAIAGMKASAAARLATWSPERRKASMGRDVSGEKNPAHIAWLRRHGYTA